MAPCESRQEQIRLYKVIDDSTVVFKDSDLIDRFSVSLGVGTDFDNSGMTKVVINQNCGASGGPIPLGCYTFSVYEVTLHEQLRLAMSLSEGWMDDYRVSPWNRSTL